MSFMLSLAEAGGVHAGGGAPPGASFEAVAMDVASRDEGGGLGRHPAVATRSEIARVSAALRRPPFRPRSLMMWAHFN